MQYFRTIVLISVSIILSDFLGESDNFDDSDDINTLKLLYNTDPYLYHRVRLPWGMVRILTKLLYNTNIYFYCQNSLGDSDDSEDMLLIPNVDGLTCSVCLDLFYRPHTCCPCDHVFCDPCLRQLARSHPINTKCPLCREVIQSCRPNHGKRNVILENISRISFSSIHFSRLAHSL